MRADRHTDRLEYPLISARRFMAAGFGVHCAGARGCLTAAGRSRPSTTTPSREASRGCMTMCPTADRKLRRSVVYLGYPDGLECERERWARRFVGHRLPCALNRPIGDLLRI